MLGIYAVACQIDLFLFKYILGIRFDFDIQQELERDKHDSPHKNLLKARNGGLFFILDTFGDAIDYILDFTVKYDCEEPMFFKFLRRKCRGVKVRANKISLQELLPDLSSEKGQLDFGKVDAWLQKLWLEKDRQLDELIPN